MRKIIISILLLASVGAVGCGAPAAGSGAITWPEIESKVFTGNMGLMETQERIEGLNMDTEAKEDLKAITYELIYIQGKVDVNSIKAEAANMWKLREAGKDFLPMN